VPSPSLERLLIRADVGPPGALARVVLGALLLPAVHGLFREPGPWTAVLSLLALLFSLKAGAAVARKLMPSTELVRAHWEWRRNLARFYDSYQWRKLVWFGLGVLAYAAAGSPHRAWHWALGAAVTSAGAAGEWFWRRRGLGIAPPLRA